MTCIYDSRILKIGNQYFPMDFHADSVAVLCNEPVMQGGDIRVGGIEDFCLVRGRQGNKMLQFQLFDLI